MLTSTTINNNNNFHGPATNLAGLFNLTGITDRSADKTQVWDTWIVGDAIAGTGPTTLTVAILRGTAPDVIPDANHDGKIDAHDLETLGAISNIETVDFSINGAPV